MEENNTNNNTNTSNKIGIINNINDNRTLFNKR